MSRINIKQRAISQAQKDERRRAILQAALELFHSNTFAEISLAEIAAKAGVAKGTVFLYFKTKEEIFLTLTLEAYDNWFRATDSRIEELLRSENDAPIAEVIKVFQDSFNRAPVLIKLIGITSVVLEQNVSYGAALNFKQLLLQQINHTGSLLEKYLPFLQPGEGGRLLLQIQALAIGFQHLAEPSPIVKEVLEKEALKLFKVDFADELSATIRLLLRGLQAR